MLGVLSVLALPAAIAGSRWSHFDLLDAAAAIPVALLLGGAAILLARRARARVRRTLAGAQGERTARLGRLLGLTGFLLGVTGAMTIAVFVILSAVD